MRVRDLRTRLGYTQASLAKASGISQSFIATIERGRGNPSLDMLEVLARTLSVTVRELVPDQAPVSTSEDAAAYRLSPRFARFAKSVEELPDDDQDHVFAVARKVIRALSDRDD